MSFISSSSLNCSQTSSSLKDFKRLTSSSSSSNLHFAKNKQTRNKRVRRPKPEKYKEVSYDEKEGSSRTVFTFIFPIVCYKTNGPFFAQCSTTKQGLCPRCNSVKIPGRVLDGGFCGDCNSRLLPSYKRWYPGLIKIDHVDETRKHRTYKQYKFLFNRFNIDWQDESQLDFVREHYTLLKVYATISDFPIEALQAERSYMVGVFAGRQYRTAALARNFLNVGLGLTQFRMDYETQLKPNERADIAENMNRKFFKGDVRCYFHAHRANIEGWLDPQTVDKEAVAQYFKYLCDYAQKHGSLKKIAEPIPDPYQKPKKPYKTRKMKNRYQDLQHDTDLWEAESHQSGWDSSSSNETDSVISSNSRSSLSVASVSGGSTVTENSVVYQPVYIGPNGIATLARPVSSRSSTVSDTASLSSVNSNPGQQQTMQPIVFAGPQGPVPLIYPSGQGQCMMMPMVQPMNCFYPNTSGQGNCGQQPFPIFVAPSTNGHPAQAFFAPQLAQQQQHNGQQNGQQQAQPAAAAYMIPQQFHPQTQTQQQVQQQQTTQQTHMMMRQPMTQPQTQVMSREASPMTPESYDSTSPSYYGDDSEAECYDFGHSSGHVNSQFGYGYVNKNGQQPQPSGAVGNGAPLPPPLMVNGKLPTHLPPPHKVTNPYNSQAVYGRSGSGIIGHRPSGCVVGNHQEVSA